MQSPTFDPTAGERARALRDHPEDAGRNPDPTDPHWGEPPGDGREHTSGPHEIFDPTNPECGKPAS
jgi:hypothetical protein